ncbi:MAG: DUF3667 domain-containing protein, partial [Opitutus sp.]
HLTHDLLENLFHFEGKFFVSLAWLLASPGRLTREFNAGRRTSQLNPLRFYLFVSVLFFLGIHLLNNGHLLPYDATRIDQVGASPARQEVIQQLRAGLTGAQLERFGDVLREEAARHEGRLDENAVREIIARVKADLPADVPGDGPPPNQVTIDTKFGPGLERKFQSGQLTLSKFIGELEKRVPTLLFLGMPVFGLFLRLLHRRSGHYYIEHLIFSIHLHTWAFLVLMVSAGYFNLLNLGPAWMSTVFGWILAGWMMWYLLVAFQRVYGRSWLKTALTLVLAGSAYSFAFMVMTAIAIVGTVAMLAMD